MMSVQLKFFHWFSYKYSFQIVHLKVPYFSLAQSSYIEKATDTLYYTVKLLEILILYIIIAKEAAMQYLKGIEKFVKGKTVFCGIDVHLKSWDLCFHCDGEVIERLKIPGNYPSLEAQLKEYHDIPSSVHTVYEAGFTGFSLYRNLRAAGYHCIVTPPNRIPEAGGKIKTDRRDAEKLSIYLAAGLLKTVHVPPSDVEADRRIIRQRANTVRKMTRIKNQIKSFLYLHGIQIPVDTGRSWSKAFLFWLKNIEFSHINDRFYLDQLLDEYYFMREHLIRQTQYLRELSHSSKYKEQFQCLLTCRGVGLITAMTFLLEIFDFRRFANDSKFSAYLGLTPGQNSSGEHVRLGHITREGNTAVRSALIKSAWTVIRHDPHLRDKYDRIKNRGTNGKKAIVAVARSLAIRLRRCLLDGVPYDLSVA